MRMSKGEREGRYGKESSGWGEIENEVNEVLDDNILKGVHKKFNIEIRDVHIL